MERQVVTFLADLLRAPEHDRWGYITAGASEGTLYALWLARSRYPNGVVYHSEAVHHCISRAVDLLALPSVGVRADTTGELDYHDLAVEVGGRRDRPAIVVANIGTAMTEAVDDVRHITTVLDELAIARRWIHADAALSGIPLSLLDPDARPGFDFADGADSLIVSGHKFLGAPMPCGVVLVRDSLRPYAARAATYTGVPDVTLTNSRSGLAALVLWYAVRRWGIEGLRARAEASRQVAAFAVGRLVGIGWEAWRNDRAFTVVLKTPPAPVTNKWVLASQAGWSHIVCMPGVTREQIDAFVTDLNAARQPNTASAEYRHQQPVWRSGAPGTAASPDHRCLRRRCPRGADRYRAP
jgi:histidine decarboxylase